MNFLITLLLFMNARAATLPAQERGLQTDMERAAVQFFLDNTNPVSGLALDDAQNFAPLDLGNRRSSIASTGFGLAVIASAAERGLIAKPAAQAYLTKTLRFVRDHVGRYKGWIFHWVDWQTGARLQNSEYSTIDTALFLAGALYAGQVFPGSEVSTLAHSLYADVDFAAMMTDGGVQPQKRTLSLHYSIESGYARAQWAGYSEELILYMLGLGSTTHPLPPEAWLAFHRQSRSLADGSTLIGFEKPLFIHQYSQLFLDLRDFKDAFGNYYVNSVRATEVNRDTCLGDIHYKTFQAGFWGLSAGESKKGYGVYGPLSYDGTVCVGCVIGSAMFSPQAVMADAEAWRSGPYAAQIWGRYGFVDSLNLDQNWFAAKILGITVGPLYLSLANMRDSTSIWRKFNRIPEIRAALAIAAAAR